MLSLKDGSLLPCLLISKYILEELQKKVATLFKAKEKDILSIFEDKPFYLTFGILTFFFF